MFDRVDRDEEGKFAFYICLPVRNEWRNIDLLRTSVQSCFTAMFADIDGCHAVAMVTGELLENALKYGSWGLDDAVTARSVFRLRAVGDGEGVEVSVQNPCATDGATIARLEETVRWISLQPNPEAAYRLRLLQIASSEDPATVGGLGLVRIAYEGNCEVSTKVEGDVLTVTARMSFKKSP